jgi:glycosyltransferase involved in cell wall biosynthesis
MGGCVIATEAEGVVDTVGDSGLLTPPEPAALARAVERLAADPSLWTELARRGHARAAQQPWARAVETLRDVYEEVGG